MSTINIKKSDGSLEPLNLSKILRWADWAAKDCTAISMEDLLTTSSTSFYDGVTTNEITLAICKNCEDLSHISAKEKNYKEVSQYAQIARNLYIPNILKKANKNLEKNALPEDLEIIDTVFKISETNLVPLNRYSIKSLLKTGIRLGVYDELLLDGNLHEDIFAYAEEVINYSLMGLLFFNGLRQMEEKYLTKYEGTILEDPQQHFMLIALALTHSDAKVYPNGGTLEFQKEALFNYYKIQAEGESNNPTPFSVNIRTPHKQYDSCCLFSSDDQIESLGIIEYTAKIATAAGAGVGVSLGRVRAKGTKFKKNGIHDGLIGILSELSKNIKSSSQISRGGSATVNLPMWHRDYYDLVVLKDNTGGVEGENRIRQLDYCFHYSKYMVNKLLDGGDILLISPHEILPSGKTAYEAFYNVDENGMYDGSEFEEYCDSVLNDASLDMPYLSSLNSSSQTPGKMAKTSAYEFFSTFVNQAFSVGRLYTLNINNVNDFSSFLDLIEMTNLCLGKGTQVLTDQGYFNIEDLEGLSTKVWNGIQWSSTKFLKTSEKSPLLSITFSNKENIRSTLYHKWYTTSGLKTTSELVVGDVLETYTQPSGEVVSGVAVESIGNDITYEPTWCCTEPLENKFVVNGILTGNCTEITEPTSPLAVHYSSKEHEFQLTNPDAETALCQLGAVVLGNRMTKEKLKRVCYWIVRMQESVFNISNYSVIPFSHKQRDRRSIGIGIVNLHNMLVREVFSQYPEKEWVAQVSKSSHEWAEAIQYWILDASIELAKILGTPGCYDRSTYSKGILPIDTWKNHKYTSTPLLQDWEALRAKGIKYGYRMSTHTTGMPVESSSVTFSNINGFEGPKAIVTNKGNKKLTTAVVVPDVEEYGQHYFYTWDKRSVSFNDVYFASVVNFQKFFDQSISFNGYFDVSGGKKIPEKEALQFLFIKPYLYGIKTTYYLNFLRDDDEEDDPDIKVNMTEEMTEEEKEFYSKLKEIEQEGSGCSGGGCVL